MRQKPDLDRRAVDRARLGRDRRSSRELRAGRKGEMPAERGDEVVLKLPFRPPYDWSHVSTFLATRALPGVERVDERGYSRTVSTGGGHAIINVHPLEAEDALELRVVGAAVPFQISAAARRAFDVSANPRRIARALKADPLMRRLVRLRPGLRIPGAWDPFECSVRAVLGQQVSVAAARTFASRLVAVAGRRIGNGPDGLTHLFPTPCDLARADLTGIGITGARIRTLGVLARAVEEGVVDFSAPVEQATAALAALPGFGDWTAQYIALRALAEPDAFPAADIVLRRMAAPDRNAPLSPPELEARAEAWRPWRGYAVLHLWAAAADARSTTDMS